MSDKNNNAPDCRNTELGTAVISDNSTGLPWPKTWQQAYLLVVANFVFWLLFLIAITELWK